MPLRIAVLISGAGSNLLAIDDACRDGRINASVVGVIADRATAAGLERAQARGLPTLALPLEAGESRAAQESRLLAALGALQPDVVALAGYLRILSAPLIAAWSGPLLNIHPSLLPRHKGLHTHQRVLEAGDREHGATVHCVTAELDAGPAILQARLAVRGTDDATSLAKRVLRCEHVIYPTVLQWLATGRLQCAAGQPLLDGRPLREPVVQDFDV